MSGFFSEISLELNRLETLRRELLSQGTQIIDLTSSNPVKEGFLFPEPVLEGASCRYFRNRSYEPSGFGLPEARQAICQYYLSRDPKLEIGIENIFVTASSSESYRLLFSLLAEPGEEILFPDLTYPLFELLAKDARINTQSYRISFDERWSLSGPSLLQVASPLTRAVVLVSPHNPTGWTLRAAIPELEELGLPVICDEVFAEFGEDSEPHLPAGSFHPSLAIFHLNGISKLFALPDLKLGWVYLNKPALERFGDRLELLNDTYLSANSLTQAMLPEIFAAGSQLQTQIRERIRSNRVLLRQTFPESGRVQVCPVSGGWQALLRLPDGSDEELVAIDALRSGVLVHPGYFYGFSQGDWLVLSCLKQGTDFLTGIRILRELLI